MGTRVTEKFEDPHFPRGGGFPKVLNPWPKLLCWARQPAGSSLQALVQQDLKSDPSHNSEMGLRLFRGRPGSSGTAGIQPPTPTPPPGLRAP